VGDDFSYIYVGEALQAAANENLAGTLLSDNPSPLKREFVEVYRQVAKRLTPAFIRFTGTRSENGELWQRLVLPIPLAGGAVILMMYSELINHQMEVYEHLFRAAPDAMVVACPITNDAGHTIDGWVVMMNDRARHLLNFDDGIGNLRLTELPQFANIGLWDRLHAPKPSAASAIMTADFEVDVMRFSHVFGLRIRPKAETIRDETVTLAPDHQTNGMPAST
jgi:PAS domain-containing protein